MPTPQLTTRLAKLEDADRLHELIHQAYRTSNGWTHEAGLVRDERISMDELRGMILLGRDLLLVAVDANAEKPENAVVGCIAAEASHLHPGMDLPTKSALIGLFAVDPTRQSNGIGSLLMREIIKACQTKWSIEVAVVWVLQQRTPLIAWYERMGFVDSGKTREFVMPDKALRPAETWFKILEKPLH